MIHSVKRTRLWHRVVKRYQLLIGNTLISQYRELVVRFPGTAKGLKRSLYFLNGIIRPEHRNRTVSKRKIDGAIGILIKIHHHVGVVDFTRQFSVRFVVNPAFIKERNLAIEGEKPSAALAVFTHLKHFIIRKAIVCVVQCEGVAVEFHYTGIGGKPKEFFVVLEYRIHIVRRQSIGRGVFDAKWILRQNQLAPKKQCYQGFIWQQA